MLMTNELEKAYKFIFDETYRMWHSDLTKIFRIGTRGTKGGCNLSSCILVLIGIESFSKFFSAKRKDANAFADFIDSYFPSEYHGKMLKIYFLFRHGLAHNFYPKSDLNRSNAATVTFGVDEKNRVVSLSRLKRDLDGCRKQLLHLNPTSGKPYVLVPQVLFLDTVNVMKNLKITIKTDINLQKMVIENHRRIRKILSHRV